MRRSRLSCVKRMMLRLLARACSSAICAGTLVLISLRDARKRYYTLC